MLTREKNSLKRNYNYIKIMREDNQYDLLFILIGTIALILGLKWKKPSYNGGLVHKYKSLFIGILFIIYGIISLIVNT
jgi:hypothetical protein